MKNVLILGGMVLVIVGIGVYSNFFATETYEAPVIETSTVTVEKEVDNINKRIEKAQQDADVEVRAKAQAEYDAYYTAEMAKIKAAVLKEIEQELESERLEVEKSITGY